MKELKSYRMSQGLTTFGIGSIIGIGDESFINTGVTNPDEQNYISFPRLARRLKVLNLRYPKVRYIWSDNGRLNVGNKFSFMRFPSWMFCPSCRVMKHITPTISRELNGKLPYCDKILLISFLDKGSSAEKIKDSTKFFKFFSFIFFP